MAMNNHKISGNSVTSLIINLLLILHCLYCTHTQVISNYMAVVPELMHSTKQILSTYYFSWRRLNTQ